MATIAMTGCEVNLSTNQLSKVVTTPFLGTEGTTISSVKFEDDTGPATYLTTNGANQRTLYLNIRGVNPSTGAVNQEVQIKVYPIVDTGPGIGKALGTINNPSPTTIFTGNVQLVLVISAAVGADTGFIGKAKITFTYESYTKCTAPTSVTVTRTRNNCKVSWSGAAGGSNNAINKYGVRWWYDDGSADGVYGTIQTKTTTATSSNYTFTGLDSRTYQFGVRTQGAAGSSYYSGWAWSSNVTVPQKPSSVTAGTLITDTQMDNLRTWINTSGITNIADATQVKATEGNTYKSGLTAGETQVEASWYNSALDG